MMIWAIQVLAYGAFFSVPLWAPKLNRRPGLALGVLFAQLGFWAAWGLIRPQMRPIPFWAPLIPLALFNLTFLALSASRLDGAEKLLRRTPAALKGGFAAALTIVIPLGALEWTAQCLTDLQLLEYFKPVQTVWLRDGPEDGRMAHITMDGYRQPDPVLLWRPIARPPYNSQGFKGPEPRRPKPSGVFRIICYGDSNTDGISEDYDPWPRKLQEILDSQAGDDSPRFEVLNAGVSGYTSYQGMQRFRQEVEAFEPDLIFVSFGWNDLTLTNGAPDNQYRAPGPAMVWLRRQLVKYRAYLTMMRYLYSRPDEEALGAEARPRVSATAYLANMGEIHSLARRRGVAAVFLTRPHFIDLDKVDEGHRRDRASDHKRDLEQLNRDLLRFAEGENTYAVDVQGFFRPGHEDKFVDTMHFNAEGHQLMAEMLYQRLVENDLLPR